MISYSTPKLSDLCTLSQSKLLQNHTLHSGTYLYSPYMAEPPPPPGDYILLGELVISLPYERNRRTPKNACMGG